MQSKLDSQLRLSIVEDLLSSLEISTDNKELKRALTEIPLPVMLIIQTYCQTHELNFEKAERALTDVLSQKNLNDTPSKNIKLIWAGLPIAEYIQQTLEEQWFVNKRTGKDKCEKLVLLTAFLLELAKIEDIDDQHKVMFAKAFLKQALKDEVWSSGKNGKDAINKSLEKFSHIETILDKPDELKILKVVCNAAAIISNYRTYANSQFDFGTLSFGFFGERQGKINLKQFTNFLEDINQIALDTTKSKYDRVKEMIDSLNTIGQKIKGEKSPEKYTELFNLLHNSAKEFADSEKSIVKDTTEEPSFY